MQRLQFTLHENEAYNVDKMLSDDSLSLNDPTFI